jgi:hypothetical protein
MARTLLGKSRARSAEFLLFPIDLAEMSFIFPILDLSRRNIFQGFTARHDFLDLRTIRPADHVVHEPLRRIGHVLILWEDNLVYDVGRRVATE